MHKPNPLANLAFVVFSAFFLLGLDVLAYHFLTMFMSPGTAVFVVVAGTLALLT